MRSPRWLQIAERRFHGFVAKPALNSHDVHSRPNLWGSLFAIVADRLGLAGYQAESPALRKLL